MTDTKDIDKVIEECLYSLEQIPIAKLEEYVYTLCVEIQRLRKIIIHMEKQKC